MLVSRGIVQAVQRTAELTRIKNLPRRIWAEYDATAWAEKLTEVLKTPGGTQTLRPLQAIALLEIYLCGGIFCPIRVGGGKTLITLLAPHVLNSTRPLLLLPAALVDKTRRELAILRQHWRVPNYLRIESYEMLSRDRESLILDRMKPDLLELDECHNVKNQSAGVTKKIKRYVETNPWVKVGAYSGTITKRSFKDYAHIVRWCLKQNAPVPHGWNEVNDWADAIDERPQGPKLRPGALLSLDGYVDLTIPDFEAARVAVRRRLVETPGVVASSEKALGTSLRISPFIVQMPELEAAFETWNDRWQMPTGETYIEALDFYRKTRELGLGFYYQWQPAAPLSWLTPRKTWGKVYRYILRNNQRHLDTMGAVVHAVDKGLYPRIAIDGTEYIPAKALAEWRAVKDSFEPNPVPCWISDRAMRIVADHVRAHPTLVWVEHRAVAEKLAALMNAPYYGEGGIDAKTGRFIEQHNPEEGSCILSIESNKEGRNLQHKWHRNFIVSWLGDGARIEQLLGRTHRDGQRADEVIAEVLLTCYAHVSAFKRSLSDARYLDQSTGQPHKLGYADITFDPDSIYYEGNRWNP